MGCKNTIFLCVNDFGVKTYSKEDLEHLQNTVQKTYNFKTDLSGKRFLGLTIDWNYERGYVDIIISGYLKKGTQNVAA